MIDFHDLIKYLRWVAYGFLLCVVLLQWRLPGQYLITRLTLATAGGGIFALAVADDIYRFL
jgi:hypothetical protein